MAADAAGEASEAPRRVEFDDGVARGFAWAAVAWAVVATLAGAWLALEVAHPAANVAPELAYGRLRAMHSGAAVLAFAGNAIFAVVYFVAQRALRTRLAWGGAARAHLGAWQAGVAAAALGPLAGVTQGREQLEAAWPASALLALAWALFAASLFATIARRTERRLPVAVWFFVATAIAPLAWLVAGNVLVPLDALHSVPLAGGAADAVAQAWCGQNAAEFLLTVPLVGAMYWIVPRVAGAPIYSHRLAVAHFWTLLAAYAFAGARPLLDTALPDRVQALAVVSGVLLWAPGWAGAINGIGTLSTRWEAIRTEPVARFFAAALGFLGLASLEGALLALRDVDAVAHYTSWIDAHAHVTALGWTGLAVAGALCWMVPALAGRPLHSRTLAAFQLYVCAVGTALYLVASWTAGGTQGSMWREVTPGGELAFPTFIESVLAVKPLFAMRALGGAFYLLGVLVMAYNLVRTAWGARAEPAFAMVARTDAGPSPRVGELLAGGPVVVIVLTLALGAGAMAADESGAILLAVLALGVAVGGGTAIALGRVEGRPTWHARLEERASVMALFVVAIVASGLLLGLRASADVRYSPAAAATVEPETALELAGRAIYVREGCQGCHSQMVRPFAYEAARYGEVSRAIDSRFDHPAQWGARRTGPDLAHEGGRYPGAWHYLHLVDPRSVSPGSVMPSYASLATRARDDGALAEGLRALRSLGVPYTDAQLAHAADDARAQAEAVARDLHEDGVDVAPDREIVALIAYLQRLGRGPSSPAGTHATAP